MAGYTQMRTATGEVSTAVMRDDGRVVADDGGPDWQEYVRWARDGHTPGEAGEIPAQRHGLVDPKDAEAFRNPENVRRVMEAGEPARADDISRRPGMRGDQLEPKGVGGKGKPPGMDAGDGTKDAAPPDPAGKPGPLTRG